MAIRFGLRITFLALTSTETPSVPLCFPSHWIRTIVTLMQKQTPLMSCCRTTISYDEYSQQEAHQPAGASERFVLRQMFPHLLEVYATLAEIHPFSDGNS